MKRIYLSSLLSIILLCMVSHAGFAQAQRSDPTKVRTHNQRLQQANRGTVGVVAGSVGGTYIRIAQDLSLVLDDSDKLRVLPIAGKGATQNVSDILYLRGVDIGIVQSDVLSFIKNKKLHDDIDKRIHYVTKLYNEEMHIIARKDIKVIEDLAGKKVNFRSKATGTNLTATNVFGSLGIKVVSTHFKHSDAVAKVKSGEIAAAIRVAGEPASWAANLKAEDGLHLIPIPFGERLQQTYLPTTFTHQDYPNLVPQGTTVPSIAVGAVMAVYNWPENGTRYKKVENFIEAFFSQFSKFQKSPRHKKWREVNLNARVPGWTRFKPADDWLKRNKAQLQNQDAKRAEFMKFLKSAGSSGPGSGSLTPEVQEQLFQKYEKWKNQQAR